MVQRIDEAARALAGAELAVTPLDGEQSAQLITAACNPDTLIPPAVTPGGEPS